LISNDLFAKRCHLSDADYAAILPHWEREDALNDTILADIMDGAGEVFKAKYVMLPVGMVPEPVRIPLWMFRKFPDDPDFELDDIERVAMAHVIHFQEFRVPTGYMECSGDIENCCKCSVAEAHDALQRLVKKGLITQHTLTETDCMGHKRNLGYFVNLPYVRNILLKYKTDMYC